MSERVANEANKGQEFFNQLKSFRWPAIGKRACGPTAAASAINLLAKNDPHIAKVTPELVAFSAGHDTLIPLNKLQYYLQVNNAKANGTHDYMPIGNTLPDGFREEVQAYNSLSIHEIVDRENTDTDAYDPTYTINGGWDHRGSERYFAKHGIRAHMLGDKNNRVDLLVLFRQIQKANMVMASVEHTQDSSHIELIVGYDEMSKSILVYDPLANAPQWIPFEEWGGKFRGYGTVIYNNTDTEELE